eukprot:811765-Rhodomonas_salina.1
MENRLDCEYRIGGHTRRCFRRACRQQCRAMLTVFFFFVCLGGCDSEEGGQDIDWEQTRFRMERWVDQGVRRLKDQIGAIETETLILTSSKNPPPSVVSEAARYLVTEISEPHKNHHNYQHHHNTTPSITTPPPISIITSHMSHTHQAEGAASSCDALGCLQAGPRGLGAASLSRPPPPPLQ